MKSLAVNGFTTAQVTKALLRSQRTLGFRFERYDKQNKLIGNFPGIISGEVDHAAFADIKRTAKFKIKTDEAIDWSSERIKPWVRLKMGRDTWAEWPLGLFLMSSPGLASQGPLTKTREVEAYDQTFILLSDKTTTRLNIPAGRNVISAVDEILAGAGIPLRNLVPTDKTLPTAREYAPGQTKSSIVNDLLGAINYQSLWFDSDGFAVGAPYRPTVQQPTAWRYHDDALSVLTPDGNRTLDLFEIPNSWVIYVSDPERPPLRSAYTNSSPDSPTSTASRGFTIVDAREDNEAVDQETLDAKVLRLANDASQIYEKVEVSTGIMPMHEHLDILELRHERLEVTEGTRYQETNWKITLKAGTTMTHSLRRLVVL